MCAPFRMLSSLKAIVKSHNAANQYYGIFLICEWVEFNQQKTKKRRRRITSNRRRFYIDNLK